MATLRYQSDLTGSQVWVGGLAVGALVWALVRR